MGSKEPDNKEFGKKYDQGKPMMNLLPFDSLVEVAKVLTFGADKYAPDSWRTVPNGDTRYEAALLRHLAAYKQGELIDPESGLSHLAHVACNALFILGLEEDRKKKDGRCN